MQFTRTVGEKTTAPIPTPTPPDENAGDGNLATSPPEFRRKPRLKRPDEPRRADWEHQDQEPDLEPIEDELDADLEPDFEEDFETDFEEDQEQEEDDLDADPEPEDDPDDDEQDDIPPGCQEATPAQKAHKLPYTATPDRLKAAREALAKIQKEAYNKLSEYDRNITKWIVHHEVRILTKQNTWEIFEPAPFQKVALRNATRRYWNSKFKYSTIVFCWPRRHSKTICNALLVLWRFFNENNHNIKVVANSARQTVSTNFKLLRTMILNSPKLLDQLGGAQNVTRERIVHPGRDNLIEAVNSNDSSLYGEKVTIAWVTELHAARNDDVLQVLASSLGDSDNSWMLIDSTTDMIGGPLHKLENLSKAEDKTIFFHRIEYKDWATANRLSPKWLDRRWLKSRSQQMLPALFASQHLNKRTTGVNALFEADKIEACESDFPNKIHPAKLPELLGERKWIVGGGLDRAYGFTLNGDATIWTTVAKVAAVDGEPEYFVLSQRDIPFSQGKGIKKAIAKDHEKYKLENVVIERYNAQDIFSWCVDSKIAAELGHGTPNEQMSIFTELHRIVSDGRLHFPAELKQLSSEMRTFRYDLKAKQNVTFGHAEGFHDDRVYSLAWAIYALRERELVQFVLPSIRCHNKSRHAPLCYLREGDAILHCSNQCEAHKRVEQMFLYHRQKHVDKEPSIPEFFKNMVRLDGPIIYQGV